MAGCSLLPEDTEGVSGQPTGRKSKEVARGNAGTAPRDEFPAYRQAEGQKVKTVTTQNTDAVRETTIYHYRRNRTLRLRISSAFHQLSKLISAAGNLSYELEAVLYFSGKKAFTNKTWFAFDFVQGILKNSQASNNTTSVPEGEKAWIWSMSPKSPE